MDWKAAVLEHIL